MIHGILTNLRAIELDDSALVYDWFNTPAVMDGWGFGVAVVSRTIVAERVAEWIDQERTAGRPVAFIIERAADRRALGLLLAIPLDRERRILRLSLLIGDQDEWGNGYGGDAVDAFLVAAFDGWNAHRIELELEAGNTRAARLYATAGFQVEAVKRGHRVREGVRLDVSVLSIVVDDWRNRENTEYARSRAQNPDEPFDVVLADGTPAGYHKPRWRVHRDGDWHRSLHVWVCGLEDGEPFLDFQRRAFDKDTYPGALDATIGGHLTAGEHVAHAYREIEEEVGIVVDPGELFHVGTRRGVNEQGTLIRDREIQELHLLRWDRPLGEYRLNVDELAGMVRVRISDAVTILSGARSTIECRYLSAPDRSIEVIDVGIDDFIPTIDHYFLRVALACSRFLAGETPIVV